MENLNERSLNLHGATGNTKEVAYGFLEKALKSNSPATKLNSEGTPWESQTL